MEEAALKPTPHSVHVFSVLERAGGGSPSKEERRPGAETPAG